MAITENTRICERCRVTFEHVGVTIAECPTCGLSLAPRVEVWPAHLKRWLTLELLRAQVAALRPPTLQALWERVLLGRMRGRWTTDRTKLLTHAASAAECYAEAQRLADAWQAAGAPNLLDFDQPEQAPAKRIA